MSRLTDKDLYLQVISPLDADEPKFFISELDGGEGISTLFAYRLTLMTPDNAIDFTQLVEQRLTVTIQQFSGEMRYINGVVTRFIQGRTDTRGITTYFAEIRPWLWQLTLTTNSRIFQELSVPEIIETVFSDMGLTDFDNRTTGTYEARTYCVQYGETRLRLRLAAHGSRRDLLLFRAHRLGSHPGPGRRRRRPRRLSGARNGPAPVLLPGQLAG